jgi:hypothetical protein
MKKITTIFIFAGILLFVACGTKEAPSTDGVRKTADADKMIYGLACDGCSDSVIVFMPFNLGDSLSYPDPISLNIVEAMRNKQVFGHPEIGDWVGVMMNPDNPKEATMVVDLDQLKGTWTYQVLPKLKQMATKSEKQIEAELTDSMREILFVPREYGFSLKRSHNAEPVGRVRRSAGADEDSPVEYPEVKHYVQWFSWNGKLILVSQKRQPKTEDHKDAQPPKPTFDTLDYVKMTNDTLILMHNGEIQGYHRKSSARQANEQANKKAAEADKKAAENLK